MISSLFVWLFLLNVGSMQDERVAKVSELNKMLDPEVETLMLRVLQELCRDAR